MPVDPSDGLEVDMVGPWAQDKHALLRLYITISSATRKKYLPPANDGGASYIDLYSGFGRSQVEDTTQIIDGSPLVAFKTARDEQARFSEIHLADVEEAKCETARQRIKALGDSAQCYVGEADVTVTRVVEAINPYGLHFAFLDPYSLQALPFSVIEALARIRRMDILVHVSAQDLQRNLDRYLADGDTRLERFMPGWRNAVSTDQSQNAIRGQLFDYWLAKIQKLGLSPAKGMPLIAGENNQRLYWLVFISRSDFANRLWDAISSPGGQGRLI
jgi:three-Cys-motif partner protein